MGTAGAAQLSPDRLESGDDLVPVGDDAAGGRGRGQTETYDFQYEAGNFHVPDASFFKLVDLTVSFSVHGLWGNYNRFGTLFPL